MMNGSSDVKNRSSETATLAGGCFWCTEAVFSELKGVEKVGGKAEDLTFVDEFEVRGRQQHLRVWGLVEDDAPGVTPPASGTAS